MKAFFTQAFIYPIHIAGTMCRLHRRDNAQVKKTGQIIAVDDLRMFNPVSRILASGSFKYIKRKSVCSIANTMDRNLKSRGIELAYLLSYFFLIR